jgi:hypothetical protein
MREDEIPSFQPKPKVEQDIVVCGAEVGDIYQVLYGRSISVANSPVILNLARWLLLRISVSPFVPQYVHYSVQRSSHLLQYDRIVWSRVARMHKEHCEV